MVYKTLGNLLVIEHFSSYQRHLQLDRKVLRNTKRFIYANVLNMMTMKNIHYFLSMLAILIVSSTYSVQSQEKSSIQTVESDGINRASINASDSLKTTIDLDSINNQNSQNQLKELNKPNDYKTEMKQSEIPSENELVPLSKENIPEQIMQQDMEKPEETVDEEKNPE